jgi:probable HAF family extracellular repeat protein
VARAILLLAVSCAYAEQYTLTDLGTLGGGGSFGEAINNHGQITGITNTANGTATAFLYTDGKMTGLGFASGGAFSEGTSINSAGVVAGISGVPGISVHAVIFGMDELLTLEPLAERTAAVTVSITLVRSLVTRRFPATIITAMRSCTCQAPDCRTSVLSADRRALHKA